MNRADLERLGRDDLITRAETAGVTRARILTRPELVDELLLRSTADRATKQRSRGFFGRARDLLASVVEQGLNLPDAAQKIRAIGGPPPARSTAPAALPTVTLAEIYVAQGHRSRAVETLDGVLSMEPEHAAARALREQLRDDAFPVPSPRLPPEDEGEPESVESGELDGPFAVSTPRPDRIRAETTPPPPSEPDHMLDDSPLPPRYDVDECVAIPVDPTTMYVYWEVRDRTIDYVRAARPGGTIALRVVVVVPTWDGPRSDVRTHDVHATLGEYFLRDLPAGSVVRVAIGYRVGDAFVAITHSPALETPPGGPSAMVADALLRWTPLGALRVSGGDPDIAAIERALGRVRREVAAAAVEGGAWGNRPTSQARLGGSEGLSFGSSERLGASERMA
jgi:hypothetical protein